MKSRHAQISNKSRLNCTVNKPFVALNQFINTTRERTAHNANEKIHLRKNIAPFIGLFIEENQSNAGEKSICLLIQIEIVQTLKHDVTIYGVVGKWKMAEMHSSELQQVMMNVNNSFIEFNGC